MDAVYPTRAGHTLGLVPENVPDELKTYDHWVVHLDKEPYDPKTSKRASTTDSRTWATFAEALEAYETGQWHGVGFVFSSGDPFVGIDLDDCRDDAGMLAEWAEKIVEAFPNAYKEISPSGRGIHIIARGKAPGHKRGSLEIYCLARYFRITGVAL